MPRLQASRRGLPARTFRGARGDAVAPPRRPDVSSWRCADFSFFGRKPAAAEAQAHNRMTNRPVPATVNGQPPEQRLVALEQLLDRVQEQALAEAPGAREDVVLALVDQPRDAGGLVDAVVVPFPDLPERLDADRQSASGQESTSPPTAPEARDTIVSASRLGNRLRGGAVVRLSGGGSSINRSNRTRKVSERISVCSNDDRRVIALSHVRYSSTVRRPIQVVEADGSGLAAGPATPGFTRSCPRRERRFPDRESRRGVTRSGPGRRSCGRTDRDAGQVSSRLATRG